MVRKVRPKIKIKALALFSGGLDSTLSAKIILDQGVQVEGAFFLNSFLSRDTCPPSLTQGRGEGRHLQTSPVGDSIFNGVNQAAHQLGIKLHTLDISQPHLELVRSPRYGYGSNMNPCIDCRILMLKEAKLYMQNHGFSFLISGEVLGQRPMSQRKDTLNIIDRDADIKGLVLRPLSAKLLSPTLAEEKGWVNRNKLFDFSGRSRRPQLALAQELEVREYSSPAGGCLLTQAEFARKFRDLLTSEKVTLEDVDLLKVGRHFRSSGLAKIIVGRNEKENKYLLDSAGETDTLFEMRDFTGPITVIRQGPPALADARRSGEAIFSNGLIEAAAKITARYSRCKDKELAWVDYWSKNSSGKKSIQVTAAGEELIERIRI